MTSPGFLFARARPSAPSLSDVEIAQAVSPGGLGAFSTYYTKAVIAGWDYDTAARRQALFHGLVHSSQREKEKDRICRDFVQSLWHGILYRSCAFSCLQFAPGKLLRLFLLLSCLEAISLLIALARLKNDEPEFEARACA